jgi:3',5'-cyclic AMP phosphodiesterase CpdA
MKKFYLVVLIVVLEVVTVFASYSNLIQQNIVKIEELSRTSTSSTITIAAFGDTKDGVGILKDIVNDLNKKRYDFAIYTGDAVRYGSYSFFNEFSGIMSSLKRPYVTVMGNHEYYNDDGENYSKFYGKKSYSFVYKNLAVISFDDANPNSWRIDWKWLSNEIKKYNDNPKVESILLAMHIPPIDPRPNGSHCLNLFYQNKLLNAIKNSKVKIIISGHIHLYWYGQWKGINVLITGGAGAPLYAGPKNGGFYHYTIITLTKTGKVKIELEKIK